MADLTPPAELQQQNHKLVIDNLHKSHEYIEHLIHKAYRKQDSITTAELRQVRNKTSDLIADFQDKNISSFNRRQGNLDDFYEAEECFMKSSTGLLEFLQTSLDTAETVDTLTLERKIDSLATSFRNRIMLTDELNSEYEDTKRKQQLNSLDSHADELDSAKKSCGITHGISIEKDELDDTEYLSKLYNYINLLEEKYSKFQPEISPNGDYIADKNWKIDVTKRSVSGVIKDNLFRKILTIETYCYPIQQMQDFVEHVQSQANAVGKKQHKNLCLIANEWNDGVKVFARNFIHQRMSLFLYELKNDTLIFNDTSESANHLKFWHSHDTERQTLNQSMNEFIEEAEYFTLNDIEMKFGLNHQGANELVKKMLNQGIIVDVGLESPKYVKSKNM
ncbi:MarR family transcriptional regulator [Methanohalophilus portucalensis]|uniref:MarR family transcriptional regulator n=2 Tax=Methanohalophilus portucalensis TaxID=39664 RepID=A0A1L9C2V9_9EURY|nr:MarR family transcriptional regulator [Methanohalophilus portucalensis]ATU07665.1 hypothetical protein BKM01_02040 [Methanohalophilus portucalensis]OJH48806.1 hypothetical protein MPF_1654 [Methanohalophilus portucalensis FDF-1]RNI08788.1 MarR family transcriptional regulator [Methanohalophilus portucalensis FDF-1]SMH37009.1 hypothetical protein SAMN06264941_1108 [Methanohalophilus portucalensis FDF-1]